MRHSEHHLQGDITAPARSRRLLEAWAVGHSRRHEMVLALSELVANAVVHAGTEIRERGVSIHFEESDSCVRVSVHHPGRAFTPVIRHGHSGLALVAGSVDRWGIDQQGPSVEVWFEIDESAVL
ncbi:MAG: ATP-binding protein [Acidimicrobiia bacterium]